MAVISFRPQLSCFPLSYHIKTKMKLPTIGKQHLVMQFWNKTCLFYIKFNRSLFHMVTIIRHWFRHCLHAEQAASLCLKQWLWSLLTQRAHIYCSCCHIHVSLGLTVLRAESPLTHWGQEKMAAISQTTVSNEFCWMKMYELESKFQ